MLFSIFFTLKSSITSKVDLLSPDWVFVFPPLESIMHFSSILLPSLYLFIWRTFSDSISFKRLSYCIPKYVVSSRLVCRFFIFNRSLFSFINLRRLSTHFLLMLSLCRTHLHKEVVSMLLLLMHHHFILHTNSLVSFIDHMQLTFKFFISTLLSWNCRIIMRQFALPLLVLSLELVNSSLTHHYLMFVLR